MNCLFCGRLMSAWVSSPIDPKTRRPTRYGSAEMCPSCDIGSIVPQPTPDEVPDFYTLDNYYTQGSSHFEKVAPTLADRILTKLAWQIDHGAPVDLDKITSRFTRPGSVCDLGCGNGDYLIGLKGRGWAPTGVEPDPAARTLLAARGVDSYPGTAEQLPAAITGSRFDLVILTHVLEHCLDPRLALHNAASLLKQGGLLLVEVPNKDCAHFDMLGAGSECYDAPRHLFFFGPVGLRRQIEMQGLIVQQEYQHGFTRHHSPGWRATERRIRNEMIAAGANPVPPDHSWGRSLFLLLQEAITSRNYDATGLWARKPR